MNLLDMLLSPDHNGDRLPEIFVDHRHDICRAPAGRHWDTVVDTSGYVLHLVRAAAETVAPNVGHYTFISSISVDPDTSIFGIDEDASVRNPG